VRITNCAIDVGDDNVAVKSGVVDAANPGADSSGISIVGCAFGHGHGVSIGSETVGGVRDVLVAESAFEETQFGVRIKTNREVGGPISHIVYRNLTMRDVGQPIAIAGYYPRIPSTDEPQPITSTTPVISDVQICTLEATGARTAGYVVGLPERSIVGVALRNVTIATEVGLLIRDAALTAGATTISPSRGAAYVLGSNGTVAEVDTPTGGCDGCARCFCARLMN
ncbi:MAG: hypothetical protein QOF51_2323, partial [Chloroflexota bacterium]|nr:hypothetical protein [Chloroflexota bacterium]